MQPTGENGATRAPINIDLQRDPAVSSKSIVLQSVGKSQEVSASEISTLSEREIIECGVGLDFILFYFTFVYVV